MTDFMMEAEMEAPATPMTNDGGDEDQHPWPYLREMFSYVGWSERFFVPDEVPLRPTQSY